MDRTRLLMVGMLLLVAADVVLAIAPNVTVAALGVALWGLHMGFTQGIMAALVADTSPKDLRGAAFGVLSLVTGVALMAASVLAGSLWQAYGSSATFFVGAAFALAAILTLVSIRKASRP